MQEQIRLFEWPIVTAGVWNPALALGFTRGGRGGDCLFRGILTNIYIYVHR